MKKVSLSFLSLLFVQCILSQEVLHVQNGATLFIQSGAEITVQGGITLNSSGLANFGTIRIKNNVTGNQSGWTDNSATGAMNGTGLVIFNSDNPQTFTGTTTFFNVSIDAPGHFTLNSNLLTLNKLRFINGKINTGPNYIYLANTSVTSLENDVTNTGYPNSWVNGTLRRSIDGNTSTYDFPVGNATGSNLLQFINNDLEGVSFLTASFGPKPGNDVGLNVTEGAPYMSVNDAGVWYLNPDLPPTSGNYALHLYIIHAFTGFSDNRFGILRRPDASSNAADWIKPPGSSLEPNNGPGRVVAHGFARRYNMTTFSQFGIGLASAALPVEFLSFEATHENKKTVKLDWKTATESKNKGFEVERQFSFENGFTNIGFEPTKAVDGNSQQQLSYTYRDLNGYAGVTYYRIKQVDMDNHFTLSVIKAVKGSDGTTVDITIMPNPNKGQFKLMISGVTQNYDAFITDISGRIVKQFRTQPVQSVNLSALPAGTYIITIKDIFGKGGHFSEQIIIVQ